MTPDVGLNLVNYDSIVEFKDGLKVLRNQEVDVITVAVGYFLQPETGDGEVAQALDRAVTGQGDYPAVPVVAAVGNYADKHWQGSWTDADGNNVLNWAGSDEANVLNGGQAIDAGEQIKVYLKWDEWQTTDQDYDLYLVDSNGDVVGQSTRTQDGNDRPTEKINVSAPATDTYYVYVKKPGASGTQTLELYSENHDLEYKTAESSVVAPATADKVIGVGAHDAGTDSPSSFSSKGPTNDGDRAVDLVGPSGVTVTAYDQPFTGTSSSVAHVAGAVALLRAVDDTLSHSQMESILTDTAEDIGATGIDDKTGYGKVDVAEAVDQIADIDSDPPSIAGFDLSASGQTLTVTLDSNESLRNTTVTIEDGSGATVATLNRPDFSESGTTYTASVDVGTGDYTATLETVTDDVGNDESPGLTASASTSGSADLSLTSVSAPSTATVGETITVEATIENTGSASGTAELDYEVDGTFITRKSVSVSAGGSRTVQFSYTPDSTGDITHEVFFDGTTKTDTTTVTQAVTFEITATSIPGTVGEDEQVSVDATVENTGGESGTQTVEVTVDGSVQYSESVTLGPGEQQTISTSLGPLSVGDHTVGVRSDDDSASQQVTVESTGSATMSITSVSVPSSVTQGETLSADISVENTGDAEGTQTVRFGLDTDGDGSLEVGEPEESRSITLSAGASRTVSLSVSTSGESAGTYDYRASTDDDTATGQVTIEAANSPPTADAGADQTVDAGVTVSLDAGGSSDPDGDSLSYSWTQTGGPTVTLQDDTTATPTFTAPDATSQQTLTFEVTVDDGQATDTDTVSVTVDPGAQTPTADAGPDQSVSAGASVSLDATGSSDPNGDSLSYSWTQTGGPSVTIQDDTTATPTFDAPDVDSQRTLTFEVTVDDGEGHTDTDSVSVTVSPGNSPPTADAGADQTVDAATTVSLDAGGSSDPDGDSLSYSWVQTGGPTVTLQDETTVTPSFSAPSVTSQQTLTFEVTVDDGQATDTDTVSVTVRPDDGGGGAEWVVREPGRTTVAPGGTVKVTLSAEFDESINRVGVYDQFSGPIDSSTLTAVTLDGESIANKVFFKRDDPDLLTAVVEDMGEVTPGTLNVTYELTINESASEGAQIQFTGRPDKPDVDSNGPSANFETESITVSTSTNPAAQYDENGDGTIDDGELRAAINDWVLGKIGDELLQAVIEAWVQGSL